MNNDIELLQDWIARDRGMRNNSTQSDYDKFCEEKCEAIEHIICENAQYSEHNMKLEQALIDTDRELREYKKALELACDKIGSLLDPCGESENAWFYDFDGGVVERKGFEHCYKSQAEKEIRS